MIIDFIFDKKEHIKNHANLDLVFADEPEYSYWFLTYM